MVNLTVYDPLPLEAPRDLGLGASGRLAWDEGAAADAVLHVSRRVQERDFLCAEEK